MLKSLNTRLTGGGVGKNLGAIAKASPPLCALPLFRWLQEGATGVDLSLQAFVPIKNGAPRSGTKIADYGYTEKSLLPDALSANYVF
ncbi:hypothetical protein HQ945_09745 [Phyllobacterium sp. BT25]|uniref:Uncharacterized protein n=1 Tax=Phyllobacterium pellucidum TaxID=2740464 RepID=A0A849VUK3_9HYPH|nr:hypothetical protein [Phyllobacterium pellucidum]NTS31533.1 hypothetical protein [Phyllobacterium pellucidum]